MSAMWLMPWVYVMSAVWPMQWVCDISHVWLMLWVYMSAMWPMLGVCFMSAMWLMLWVYIITTVWPMLWVYGMSPVGPMLWVYDISVIWPMLHVCIKPTIWLILWDNIMLAMWTMMWVFDMSAMCPMLWIYYICPPCGICCGYMIYVRHVTYVGGIILMAQCKPSVSPLLKHWRYSSLAMWLMLMVYIMSRYICNVTNGKLRYLHIASWNIFGVFIRTDMHSFFIMIGIYFILTCIFMCYPTCTN